VEFDRYLAAAVEEVENALEGGGVAILVPPGSARGEVARRLVEEKVVDDVLLYEELHKRVGVGRPHRREGDRLYVVVEGDKVSLLQYLKGNVMLGSALRQRKVVIVPRDTQEALLIRDELLRALAEEKTRIPEDVKELVKVLFLPALYQEGDEDVAKLAETDYGDVPKGVMENAKGVSPSLARLAREYKARGGLDDLKQLITAIRGLTPEQSAKALYELAGEVAGGFASEAASKAVEEAPGALVAGAALAVMGLNPLAIVAGAAAGWAARKIIDKVKELLDKARGRRADVSKDVWTLLQLAKSVYPSLCPRERAEELERLEAVVDEVAAKWGMSIGHFKAFVCNLGALAASRVVTEEELEERLRRLEDLALLRASAPAAVYVEAWEWPYVAEVGEGLAVLEGAVKGPYVETRLEEALAKRLEAAVEGARGGGGRIILFRGAKGVGKSTAAAAALYKLLKRGGVTVAVFDLGAAVDEVRTAQFLFEARRRGLVPLLYLDPSRLEFYSSHALARPPITQATSNLIKLVELAKRGGAVALVVLSEDQAEAMARSEELGEEAKKMLLSDIDSVEAGDVVEVEPFVKALVEKYSGCSSDVVEGTAKAIVSSFKDGYAVAAVLAADWLKRGGCRSEEVKRAVERAKGDVHRFALDYIWHVVLGKDVAVARQHAPLLLAVGFFGPHPPKLAEAIVRAFGKEPEDAVVRWFSQPLHGTLYETIRKVAHGAVYRRFKVGNDELCQGSKEESCRLVEICSNVLKKVSQKNSVEEVAVEYAKLVAKALITPGPDGERQIDSLIDNFLQAYDHVAEDGRWRIRYETKGPGGVKTVEDVVDELDVLSALYGLAVLPIWYPELKPLKEWFFVGNRKVGVVSQYLYHILRERGGELIRRATAIVREIERRDGYTDVDLLRAVGITIAGQWDSAADEELEIALKLVSDTLVRFATFSPIALKNAEPLLSEAWHRVISRGAFEGGERRQRLADWLTLVAYNAARGYPRSLLYLFAVGIDKPNLETVAKRFDTLYNATSNAGKLLLLNMLFHILKWDIVVVAALLGLSQFTPWEVFERTAKRVEELVSHLHGVERAYIVAPLYPLIAIWYTSFGGFDRAARFAKESLNALEELWKAYEEDKASTEESLWPYLVLRQVKPDLERELDELSQLVYYHVAHVYMNLDELDRAVEYAEKACKLAEKLGDVYYEVSSCNLPLRLKSVIVGVLPVEEFEKLWQRASQLVGLLGVETVVVTLGEYVVALTSIGYLSDVEKVLEKWGWVLELHPDTSALTYGILSFFDGRYLERAVAHLPVRVNASLPKFADVLHDAIEAGLFVKEPEIHMSAVKTLTLVYGRDAVKALVEVASTSSKLFLSVLVGLAYCKRGEEWGLKLAKAAAQAGLHLFKGTGGRLFGELYKALEGATVYNCVTDEVLRTVYKLYYAHV